MTALEHRGCTNAKLMSNDGLLHSKGLRTVLHNAFCRQDIGSTFQTSFSESVLNELAQSLV